MRPYPSQLRKLARALGVPVEKADTLLVEVESSTDSTEGDAA